MREWYEVKMPSGRIVTTQNPLFACMLHQTEFIAGNYVELSRIQLITPDSEERKCERH